MLYTVYHNIRPSFRDVRNNTSHKVINLILTNTELGKYKIDIYLLHALSKP